MARISCSKYAKQISTRAARRLLRTTAPLGMLLLTFCLAPLALAQDPLTAMLADVFREARGVNAAQPLDRCRDIAWSFDFGMGDDAEDELLAVTGFTGEEPPVETLDTLEAAFYTLNFDIDYRVRNLNSPLWFMGVSDPWGDLDDPRFKVVVIQPPAGQKGADGCIFTLDPYSDEELAERSPPEPAPPEPAPPEPAPSEPAWVPPPAPLRESRPRPLAVMLDNALGYPQAGIPHASWVAELPIEGGVTRLMAFFDAGEPARVGPIRGARDYFVEIAARADAVVVHDGGSPSALIALDQGMAPSLNAYRRGDLFERAADRSAPYDLYSAGSTLRSAIRTMDIDAQRLLTGFRPAPPSDAAPRASGVAIDWSGAYDSGFRYVDAQERYRWIRNGDDAVSASDTAVQVEAVLIARINARPIPNDAEGRLYIPVSGGEALLLWRGAVMEGVWSVDGGLRFTDADGHSVALEALVTWAAFVPQGVTVELQ